MKSLNILIPMVLVVAAGAMVAIASEPSSPETLAKYDSGPATIDVSGYPAESQDGYKIFAQRCTKCHSLARPINADYALPDEWSRYVKRMMRKPGSGISKKDGKAIYEFLVYDSSVRKADLIEAKKKAGGNE